MAWDDTKVADDTILSADWNAMVTDQKSRGGTKEFFLPCGERTSAIGSYPAMYDDGYISFFMPNDFSSIVEAVAVIIPDNTSSSFNIDITLNAASGGEQYNNISNSDTTTTYSLTNGQITELDISGLFTGVSANDYVGVRVDNNTTNLHLYCLGVRIKYS